MQDTVLYMRGSFPFGIGNITESVLRDASPLLEIDADDFSDFIESLKTFAGFIDKAELRRRFTILVKSEPKATQIARFIDSFHEKLRGAELPLESFLDSLKKWLTSNDKDGKIVPVSELETFLSRVSQVLFSYPGYLRQAKAEDLSRKIGNSVESFDLICDIRPVFDLDRKTIEGCLPFTWLKLVTKKCDGLPVSTEAFLTEQDLDSLKETVEKARQKLQELKRVIRVDFGKEIPNTELVKSVETEGKPE